MMNGDEARRFGEKSLANVQVTDLNSVLKSLRLIHPTNNQSTYFNIPALDSLLPPSSTHPPILTLVSPPSHHQPSGSGKTSLVILIIATALSSPSNAIILIDPLHHFNIPLLCSTLLLIFSSTIHPRPSPSTLKEMVKNALSHLHIFHPPTYPSLLSTLRSLPTYLSNPSSHTSTHRKIHTLILEDTHAFLPSLPLTSTPAAASATLCFHLANLARLLSCALVTTSCSTSARYYRPAMVGWGREAGEVRIAVRRVEGRKVGVGVGVEEVEREKVVKRGTWCEGWRVGSGNQDGETGFLIKLDTGVEIQEKK